MNFREFSNRTYAATFMFEENRRTEKEKKFSADETRHANPRDTLYVLSHISPHVISRGIDLCEIAPSREKRALRVRRCKSLRNETRRVGNVTESRRGRSGRRKRKVLRVLLSETLPLGRSRASGPERIPRAWADSRLRHKSFFRPTDRTYVT